MLLLQTALTQEFAAVAAAGPAISESAETTINIAGKPCCILMTGMGLRAARQQLTAMLDRIERPELVLSIGLAGGLQPQLERGQTVLVGSVQLPLVGWSSQTDFPTKEPSLDHKANDEDEPSSPPFTRRIPAHLERLSSNLRERMSVQDLLSLDTPALTSHSKQRLGEQTDATLCDMESYAVADVCRQRQIPWIGARVISDTANENIPAWIMILPQLVEQKHWLGLLRRVATHPQDLPSLIRLAFRMHKLKPVLTQLTIDLVTHVSPA